jgi:LPS O-antigen subunit length determinant protein (WzzB/FepE family)
MTEKLAYDTDEVSLLDIYVFFRDGWKMIVLLSALGLIAGVAIAYVLPEKFNARALIESASVGKKGKDDTIASATVEPVAVLAEKMKVPTYYSASTIQACRLNDFMNPADELVKRLNSSVARNSTYVSLTFKAESPAIATVCLESVLKDVAANQALLAQPLINNLQADLESAEDQLKAITIERDELRKKNPERLAQAKAKISAAEKFIDTFTKDSTTVKSTDPQFSASAVLLPALMAKQAEIQDLEKQIDSLSLSVAANSTEKDQDLRKIAGTVSELKNALMPPNTKPATFAAPIYSPNTKVEPKRSVIILVGLVAGGFLGLLLLVGIRVRNKLHARLNTPR